MNVSCCAEARRVEVPQVWHSGESQFAELGGRVPGAVVFEGAMAPERDHRACTRHRDVRVERAHSSRALALPWPMIIASSRLAITLVRNV